MHDPFKMIVTVSLILLDERREKVLLLRRKAGNWAVGEYAFIAGCLDGNETATEALAREAREEANIILKPEDLECVAVIHSNIPGRRSQETIDFFFWGANYEGIIQNNEPHKHDNLDFYPLNNLPQPMQELAKLGLNMALNGEGPYTEFGWERK